MLALFSSEVEQCLEFPTVAGRFHLMWIQEKIQSCEHWEQLREYMEQLLLNTDFFSHGEFCLQGTIHKSDAGKEFSQEHTASAFLACH